MHDTTCKFWVRRGYRLTDCDSPFTQAYLSIQKDVISFFCNKHGKVMVDEGYYHPIREI